MSATSSIVSSVTSTAPSATRTGGGGGGGGGNNGGPSSPLLFFVALGFGVVFTNLWIIVGVKYCFRYNQRNRQRMNGEAPDAVDMGTMPRQHRRRREKKLMSMEEVNEKFPLTKYKAWRSTRAEEGLPTAGGIATTANSRAPSIRDETRDSKEVEQSIVQSPTTTTTENEKAGVEENNGTVLKKDIANTQPDAATTSSPRPHSSGSDTKPITTTTTGVSGNDEDGDEDDHIQTAVPAEQLPDPGDACAICIDTIEDDDDVRGLHCGHAFHASCVDPWLTSRRACCPLCKADYYVPKPRPEGADAEGRRRGDGVNLPGQPPFAFMGGPNTRRPTMVLPGRFMTIVYDENDRYGFPRVVREPRPPRPGRNGRRQQSAPTLVTTENGENVTQNEQTEQRDWRRRLTAVRIPNPVTTLRGWRGGEQPNPSTTDTNTTNATTTEAVTPAQLEAGRG